MERRVKCQVQHCIIDFIRSSDMRVSVGLLVLLASLLSACSSGGGGGANLSYTGASTAAVLSVDNAETLALESFSSGHNAAGTSDLGALSGVTSHVSSGPDAGLNAARLFRLLHKAAGAAIITSGGGGQQTLVSLQRSETISGSCGGSVSNSMTINDATLDISLTSVFKNYCEGGVTISGNMSLTLILDAASVDYGLMTMTFINLRFRADGESVAMSGNMRFSYYDSVPVLTTNMLIQDATGKVFKIENMIITMAEGVDGSGDYLDISMEGRFYDPDYGYVELVTTTPMRVYYLTDNWPSAGSYVLIGANAATVTMTADAVGYTLELDLDGVAGVDDSISGAWPVI